VIVGYYGAAQGAEIAVYATSTSGYGDLWIERNGTAISWDRIKTVENDSSIRSGVGSYAVMIDTPTAGTHTYRLRAAGSATTRIYVTNIKTYAYEL
jgi:hypothetical protein